MYNFINIMGLFKKKEKEKTTQCTVCKLECHNPERLARHIKKAHGNVPEKKLDPTGGAGGTW